MVVVVCCCCCCCGCCSCFWANQIRRGSSLFLLWLLFFPVVVFPFVVVVGRLMPISDRAGRLAQLWLLLVLQPTTIDLSPHMSETQSSILFHIPRANHCNALESLKSFEPFQLLEPLEPLKPFEPLQPPNWLVTAHVRNLMFHLNQSFTQVYRVWDAANSSKVTVLYFDWKTIYHIWLNTNLDRTAPFVDYCVNLPSSRNCDLLKLLLRRSGSDCN